jgi:hypothetical protein
MFLNRIFKFYSDLLEKIHKQYTLKDLMAKNLWLKKESII